MFHTLFHTLCPPVSGKARHNCAGGHAKCEDCSWFWGPPCFFHFGSWGHARPSCTWKCVSLNAVERYLHTLVAFLLNGEARPNCSRTSAELDMWLGGKRLGRFLFSHQRVIMFSVGKASILFVCVHLRAESQAEVHTDMAFFVASSANGFGTSYACTPRRTFHGIVRVSSATKFAGDTLRVSARRKEAANSGKPSANHWTTPKTRTPV